jgi:hypothetical protein
VNNGSKGKVDCLCLYLLLKGELFLTSRFDPRELCRVRRRQQLQRFGDSYLLR